MASYMEPQNTNRRKRSPDLSPRTDGMVPVPPPRDAFQLYFAAYLTATRRGIVLSTEWTHHVASVWERCKKMWPSVPPSDKQQMDVIARNERSFYDTYWARVASIPGFTHESAVREWEKHAQKFTEQLLDEVKIDYSNLSSGYVSGPTPFAINPYHQLGGMVASMDGSSSHHQSLSYLGAGYPTGVALQNTVYNQSVGQPAGTRCHSPPSISGLYPYGAGESSQYSMPSWNNGVHLTSSQGYTLSSSTVSSSVTSPRPGSANIPVPITQRRRSANPSRSELRADNALASTSRRPSIRGRRDAFRVTNAEMFEAKMALPSRKSKRTKPNEAEAHSTSSASHASTSTLKGKLKQVFS